MIKQTTGEKAWADETCDTDQFGRDALMPKNLCDELSATLNNMSVKQLLTSTGVLDQQAAINYAIKFNRNIPFKVKEVLSYDEYLYTLPWLESWLLMRQCLIDYGLQRLCDPNFVLNNPEVAEWLNNDWNIKNSTFKQQKENQFRFKARFGIIRQSRKPNSSIRATDPIVDKRKKLYRRNRKSYPQKTSVKRMVSKKNKYTKKLDVVKPTYDEPVEEEEEKEKSNDVLKAEMGLNNSEKEIMHLRNEFNQLLMSERENKLLESKRSYDKMRKDLQNKIAEKEKQFNQEHKNYKTQLNKLDEENVKPAAEE